MSRLRQGEEKKFPSVLFRPPCWQSLSLAGLFLHDISGSRRLRRRVPCPPICITQVLDTLHIPYR